MKNKKHINSKIRKYILIFLVAYIAVILRFHINNNFLVTYFASFIYGFSLAKSINKHIQDILFIGFCSSITTFSGFASFFYNLFGLGKYLESFLLINYLIILNLLIMYLGFLFGKKINR